MGTESLMCVRCQKPVTKNREFFELFEKMHWLCFHLEYEHEGDPDEACGDPGCPWWHIQILRQELEHLGRDPEKVLEEAIKQRYGG